MTGLKTPINGHGHPPLTAAAPAQLLTPFEPIGSGVPTVHPATTTVKALPERPTGEIDVVLNPTWHTELLASGVTLLQVHDPKSGAWLSLALSPEQCERLMKVLLEQALRTPK